MQNTQILYLFYQELFTKPGGVLSAVKQKMPWLKQSGIKIQHDGASPHTGKGTVAVLNDAAKEGGWNIKINTQPAQSPDLNILDLGFFHSLQSRVAHVKHKAKNIDELITNVTAEYNNYDRDTLDHIWAHQIDCWRSILAVDGDNQYKKAHGGGRRRHKNSTTAVDLTINIDDYNRVFNMYN